MMAKIIDLNGNGGTRTVRLNNHNPNVIKVTDLSTGACKVISITAKRVMKRANALYQKGRALGVTDVPFHYFLTYSWRLEKGHVWAK